MAGTGKSAIARTICEQLKTANMLGGSFFCSRRASKEEQDIRRIVPTLARQLSRLNLDYRKKLVACLQEDLDIVGATTYRQLSELIINPCRDSSFPSQRPSILVIDALDEGSRTDDTARLLEAILGQAARLDIPLRFFVTSRPEHHIRSRFEDPSHRSEHATFHLHNIEESIVRADIQLYIANRLKTIKTTKSHSPGHQLPEDWPTEKQTEQLVDRADKLFIYAFTACNYIERDPFWRLPRVINSSSSPSNSQHKLKRLDEIYTFILDEAMKSNDDDEDFKFYTIIRKFLSVLIFARGTFSLAELALFMDTDAHELYIAAEHLHSLILIPPLEDLEGEVTTLHASFGDYLTDETCSGKHFIAKNNAHFFLLQYCFRILESELRFNISNARTSFESNKDQGLTLPQHLLYAGGHWSDHVVQDGLPEQATMIISWIEETLVPKFLFWLEVVSIAGKAYEASEMLQTLVSFVRVGCLPAYSITILLLIYHMPIQEIPNLIKFISDGIQFTDEAGEPISKSAPHIYLSALAFSYDGSVIREMLQSSYGRIAQMEYIGSMRVKTWNLYLTMRKISRNREGNVYAVCSAAFSPDSNRIALGYGDGIVCVWDICSGQPITQPLRGHTEFVESIAFSPDGTHFVSGANDVRIWDAQTGQLIMQLPQEHTNKINAMIYSPDGTTIAFGSRDKTVQILDVRTSRIIMSPLQGHTDAVNSVAFSPYGDYIVSGSDDHTVRVWNVQTGQPIMQPLLGHTQRVTCVTFSPNGKYIVSGSCDNTVRVWDAQSGQPILPLLKGHSSEVTCVSFSSDGTYIISGSQDASIRVWDAQAGQCIIMLLQGDDRPVTAAAYLSKGASIVSVSFRGTLNVWNIWTDQSNIDLPLSPRYTSNSDITSIAFSSDGNRIVSGSDDGTVSLWNPKNSHLIMPLLMGHDASITCVAFSLSGTSIVSGSRDYTLRVWDAQFGQPALPPLRGHTDAVTSVAFSPDGTRIVSGSDDNTVQVWDVQSGQPAIPPLKGHTDSITCVAFSPDGTRIVSGSYNDIVCVWDTQTSQLAMKPMQGHTGCLTSVIFSPNGTRIISGSLDGTVGVWDATNGSLIMQFLHDSTQYNQFEAFSLDGSRIVSQLGNQAVRAWDTKKSQHVVPPLVREHNPYNSNLVSVKSVFVSPDSNLVVSVSNDMIYMWDLEHLLPILHPFRLPEPSSWLNAVNFLMNTSGARALLARSCDNTIHIFDLPLSIEGNTLRNMQTPHDTSDLSNILPNSTASEDTCSEDVKIGTSINYFINELISNALWTRYYY
jgi:WD40 repeat protein